ncbi:MAG: hypothetical protein R3C15_09340 [Thermoleophilia bacterium]
MPKNVSQMMLLIAYTPRADSNDRGYEQWLRDVDNPFFNSVPGVRLYENWKVVSNAVGQVPFTHFDLLFVEEEMGFEAPFDNPELQKFASGWNDLWGTHPEGTFADSGVEIYHCRVVAEPEDVARTPYIVWIPYTPADDAQGRGYDDWLRAVDNPFLNAIPEITSYTNWRVEKAAVGEIRFTDFDLMHVDGADGWDRMVGNDDMRNFALGWVKEWGRDPDGPMEHNFNVAVAERIAAP